jgi:hypothetical protein
MKGSAILPLFIAALTPFLVLTVIVTTTGLGSIAWRPPVLWTNTFGNPHLSDSATVIASDTSGVYVEGYVNSSGTFGDGPGNLFLSKYDPDGGIIWTRTIGDTNDSYINGMSVGMDGIYLSGGNLTSRSVQKYDLTGNRLWERKLDIPNAEINAITSAPTNTYIAGTVGYQPIPQGVEWTALFVREYDDAGSVLWTNTFNNSTYSGITGLYASGSGVCIIGYNLVGMPPRNGEFFAKYDQSGHLTWNQQLSERASGISGDPTGIYLSGASLRKYDFSGNLVWQTQIDSPDSSKVSGSWTSADSSGVFVSAMTYLGHTFIAKYELSGSKDWSFGLSPTGEDFWSHGPYRLTAGFGGLYIAGAIGGYYGHGALVEEVSSSSSLVVFGVNPPLSFVILGGPIGVSVASLLFFRRLRRGRVRPRRVGPSKLSLPAID